MISDQQTPEEWLWFCARVTPITSFLEIGTYDGQSLWSVVSSGLMVAGGRIRSIDLGDHGTWARLQENCASIRQAGFDVQCLMANSQDDASIAWARQWAPYDVVFIDGAHAYEGVKADWENYGPMGKVVAFHDVGGHEPGCVALWREIKANGVRTAEFVADPRYQIVRLGQQGIGLVLEKPQLYSAMKREEVGHGPSESTARVGSDQLGGHG